MVAINSSAGSIEWTYSILVTAPSGGFSCGEASAPTAIYTTPVADEGIVYIGTYSGQVLALSMIARSQNLTFPQRGDGEWEWNCPIGNAKSNAIVADLVMIDDALYVASSNGRIFSLDRISGDENWRREDIPILAEKLWASPVIQDNNLYVSTYDGHIYALSIETGELSGWSFKSEAGFASAPVVYEETIFVGSFDRYLYAVNVTIGSDMPMWKFPKEEPTDNWFWASPVISEGIVYAGCLDGLVYAIEAKTGEKLWEFDAGSPIVASPALMDNLLIVINESGTVYVFDLNTELRNETVPLQTISIDIGVSSSFYAKEGLIYIRGDDNQLYVVDINSGGVRKIDLDMEE